MSQEEQVQEEKGQKPVDRTYGYSYDSSHEASLEARLMSSIKELGQIPSNGKVAQSIEGDLHTLITEIQGFLHKWGIRDSYAEKADNFISSQRNVDLFIMKNLYRDFMKQADRLGFKNPVSKIEEWEKHFLGNYK